MQSPKTMGTAIQADLAAVGINAQIQTFEWGAYLNKYGAGLDGEAGMAELSWMFDSGDPAHMLPNKLFGQGLQRRLLPEQPGGPVDGQRAQDHRPRRARGDLSPDPADRRRRRTL